MQQQCQAPTKVPKGPAARRDPITLIVRGKVIEKAVGNHDARPEACVRDDKQRRAGEIGCCVVPNEGQCARCSRSDERRKRK